MRAMACHCFAVPERNVRRRSSLAHVWKRTVIALCAGASAGAASRAVAQGGTRRIPDRLADTTFWRLVNGLSEPGGYFQSDNFVSNENEWQFVIPGALASVKPGSVYVGVGPEQNFTYIVAFAPRIAFICDIRRQNMIEHLMYKALIEMSADRAEFLSKLWSRARPPGLDSSSSPATLAAAFDGADADTALYRRNLAAIFDQLAGKHKFELSPGDSGSMRYVFNAFFVAGPGVAYTSGSGVTTLRINGRTVTTWQPVPAVAFSRAGGYPTFASLMMEDDDAGTNRGWLGTERAFQGLRDFETRNLLVPIVGDFAGDKALRAVGDYARANNARVGVFYVSNVEQYLFQSPDNWSKFYANVATLPTDSTSIFIRSLSNRNWVPPRYAGSRMAQITSSIDDIVRAFQAGRVTVYSDVVELRKKD